MKHVFVKRFVAELKGLPPAVQEKFYKQLKFLLQNLVHPSLHAKKYDERLGIWQARVDRNFRFYFQIEKDCYILMRIKRHQD